MPRKKQAALPLKDEGAGPIPGKFAVVADVHVANRQQFGGEMRDGLNERCRLILATLGRAVEEAVRQRCARLYIAGDLFDSRRPEPAVIAAVQRVLVDARPVSLEVVVIPGNHDMVDAGPEGGNTACAPLWEAAHVVASRFEICGDVVAVPFTARVPMAQHLMEVLDELVGMQGVKPSVLITHVGVWDEATASPWQKRAKDAVNAEFLLDQMEKAGVETAFVGNYHEHRHWSRRVQGAGFARMIVQVGTLCPGSFGDEGLDDRGLMWTQDADGERRRFEIPGPRFVVMGEQLSPAEVPPSPVRLFVRGVGWQAPEELEALLGGFEHVPVNDSSSPGTMAEGEEEEESPATPLEALGAFVEGMELPDGIDPGDVMALVKDCWTKGA